MSWVLILTHPEDVHADAVEKHLRDADVQVIRADTANLSMVAQLGGDPPVRGSFAGCDLAQVRCVWHRRPSEPAIQDEVAAAELRAAVGGVLAGLPHLNHPADMAVAALKPYQLATAARCGLAVPETVVGTQPAAAQELADRHGDRVVVKALSRGATGFVTAGDRSGWSRPAHLTQQRIDKAYDVRLTIVDGDGFAVRIDSQHLDWRADPDQCRYQLVDIPAAISAPVGHLLTTLRLRFAALDFAVDHAGRWWFLEVNPNGQWLWLEHATGAPISRAIATALHRRSWAVSAGRTAAG